MPFGSLSLGLGLSTVTAVAEGPSDLWPLTGMGAEADWTFETGWEWFSGTVTLFEPTASDTAELTGAAKTAFDAAISNSTAYTVTLVFQAGNFLAGTISVAMKGGTPVDFVGDGSTEEIVHTVTSGTGTGFILAGGADFPAGYFADVEIVA